MKAKLRNGKIVTGRAADIFLSMGLAKEVNEKVDQPIVEKSEQKVSVAPPAAKKPIKRKKGRGRPTKK